MHKNILCAVDTSAESIAILDKANELAEQNDAQLSIAHVIEYSFIQKDYQKILKEEAWPKINEMAEKYGIAKKRRFVKFGQPHANICGLAEEHTMDLIVVGSHGQHGIRALLGSTANGILHYANCDTLMVRIN